MRRIMGNRTGQAVYVPPDLLSRAGDIAKNNKKKRAEVIKDALEIGMSLVEKSYEKRDEFLESLVTV